RRGEYHYFVHPVSDGIPVVEPALLREIACAMVRVMDLEGVDRIVVVEAMGIHIGTALSLMTDIPLTVVRKRWYGLEGECAVHQTTGYSKGELYINGLVPGMRVVIVDDVLSTGGTMRAILGALETLGVEVVDVCVVIRRGKQDVGRPCKHLVEIEVTDHVRVVGHGV
ncbi:MAG TPA: hypoxanthine/guanine phosphoribosyltransferase, partial [Methanoregulaceae archaeon]|nr:hypoxanthine/guanine phosphoribosyltransferase [Methanoregulaceae archaeon]